MGEYKTGELLTIDGGGSSGAFGYNDKGEGISGTEPKEEEETQT